MHTRGEFSSDRQQDDLIGFIPEHAHKGSFDEGSLVTTVPKAAYHPPLKDDHLLVIQKGCVCICGERCIRIIELFKEWKKEGS